MSKDTIPHRDADFNDFQTTACPYINTRAVALGLVAGEVTAMLSIQTDWNTMWTAYIDPSTRTKSIIVKKKVLKKSLTRSLRKLIQDAKRSPALTETDRTTLNLPAADEPHTPVKPPTIVPDVEVRKIEHLLHHLNISNPEEPDSRAKPAGVSIIEVYKALSDTKPTNMASYSHALITTKTLCTVTHKIDDVKKTCWYLTRYVSTKGEPGPWSDAVSAIVA